MARTPRPRCLPAPFLKWAGGKAKLAPQVAARAPAAFAGYHEPFVGGGAVFFALQAAGRVRAARLGDANAALIECYACVRDDPDAVLGQLDAYAGAYGAADAAARAAMYYRVREDAPCTAAARAARLIFLNRTGFNGLYRENASGGFNVPHGRYANPRIADHEGIHNASRALQAAGLAAGDFEAACAAAVTGDFVYLDPPYQPLSRTSNFTAYTAGAFGPAEQRRLRDAFDSLTARGVAALLSNSDHPAIRELYAGYRVEVVPMSRAINSNPNGRAPIDELLISNFDQNQN